MCARQSRKSNLNEGCVQQPLFARYEGSPFSLMGKQDDQSQVSPNGGVTPDGPNEANKCAQNHYWWHYWRLHMPVGILVCRSAEQTRLPRLHFGGCI